MNRRTFLRTMSGGVVLAAMPGSAAASEPLFRAGERVGLAYAPLSPADEAWRIASDAAREWGIGFEYVYGYGPHHVVGDADSDVIEDDNLSTVRASYDRAITDGRLIWAVWSDGTEMRQQYIVILGDATVPYDPYRIEAGTCGSKIDVSQLDGVHVDPEPDRANDPRVRSMMRGFNIALNGAVADAIRGAGHDPAAFGL